MKKVFISYSWEHDTNNAIRIYDALTSFPEHFNVWMDRKNMQGGLKWKPAIIKEIRTTDFFIAVLSPKAVAVPRGTINFEMNIAIDVLKEFAPGQVFLIPARTSLCNSPFDVLAELNYINLYPNWDEGIRKMIETLNPAIVHNHNKTKIKPLKQQKKSITYHYKIGIVDIDGGIRNIKKIVSQLNKVQDYFLFSLPEIQPLKSKTKVIDSIKNFFVSGVSKKYIRENKLNDTDFIACFTKLPLAFEQDGYYYYNYFSSSSDYDERFMFFSTDQLTEFSLYAGKNYEEGLAYILVGQLIRYFTESSFHRETRGCPMDFCEKRAEIVEGFRKRKICKECNSQLPKGDLKNAISALLKWTYK